jgi:3-oxoacyl-[acyl-carrier-protein] synthase-3
MVGIRSLGWWVPERRQAVREIARDYGFTEQALAAIGLISKPVPGDDDHPSKMGARATQAALDAAGLSRGELDLLICTGVTKDWPPPWVAAFGVLHELGGSRAGGFDLSSRCAGVLDALWLAKLLVESGTHRHVAVCCAERFDYLMGPERRPEVVTDAIFAAGAATAIVSRDAGNAIAGFSSLTNPELACHRASGPTAGGSRQPLSRAVFEDGTHRWRGQLTIRDAEQIARYSADADRHNYAALRRQAGFDAIDFVACSPFYPEPQLRVLTELGVPAGATLFTIPYLGHIGGADLLLSLGIAIASGRRVGACVVLSLRTNVYSNALALRGTANGPGIAVAGHGVDVELWRQRGPRT